MTNYNEELIHYGVKGMRWGRRKDRESSSTSSTKGEGNTVASKPRSSSKTKSHKAVAKTMTNDELRKAIDRMTLEKNYARLAEEMRGPIQKDAKSAVKSALTKTGSEIGKQAANQIKQQLMNQAVNSLIRAATKK